MQRVRFFRRTLFVLCIISTVGFVFSISVAVASKNVPNLPTLREFSVTLPTDNMAVMAGWLGIIHGTILQLHTPGFVAPCCHRVDI